MDFLATKGIEYLLVIGYLVVLIPFWWMLFARNRPVVANVLRLAPVAAMRPWFQVPDGVHFHRGHTWALPIGNGIYRVGIDDFAQRLLGAPKAVRLPLVGQKLEEGVPGWTLQVDGQALDLLSPLGGEVTATNDDALLNPSVVCDDPYGKGWLLEVKPKHPEATDVNLLSGNLARVWMDDAAATLSRMMGPTLGPVLQDGGIPVSGFARELAGENWPGLARELLATGVRSDLYSASPSTPPKDAELEGRFGTSTGGDE